jgi:hypothetical protein
MKILRIPHVAVALAAVIGSIAPVCATEVTHSPRQATSNLSGLHDFDFFVGTWHAQHHKLKERLVNSHDWVEFDGTLTMQKLMGGSADVDDSVFNAPGGAYRGVSLYSYDPATRQWAIWGLDSRTPFANLDPPVKGHFVSGIGTFYAADTLRGKPISIRFTWSHITPSSVHFEQAFSPDGGKTWETNWITDFQRVR